jgi:putative PEP-CTERM system histidine kinase
VNETALANAALWSYGISAAGFGAFAFRLALGWRQNSRAALLLAVIVVSMIWAATGVATILWPSPRTWAASVVCDALRYALWFAFMMSVLKGAIDDRSGAPAISKPAPLWFVLLFAALSLASILLSDGRALEQSTTPTLAFGIHLALGILELVLVERLYRGTTSQARWAVRPLCIGLAGLFAFDVLLYADGVLFGRLDADIWVARGIANAMVIPFIAIAAARNERWTIEIHMSRNILFHSTALLVSGAFLLAISVAGYFVRYFGGEWGRAIEIVISFGALLAATFVASSGSFRAKLRVFVSKHFFSYRYDYRDEWLRFTRKLSNEGPPLHGVQERTIMALADFVESPGGVLWQAEQHGFRQVARCNMPAVDGVEPIDGSFVRFLARTGWVVNLAEYAKRRERYPDMALPTWLSTMRNAWLVVPLMSGTHLVGFVVLANPRTTIEVNWEVLDLLKTAGRQAASFLGHIAATDALLEFGKFDAFNRMSAFVVHDLKNLVAQLSLMLKNAERHRENPEFQRDMLATVEHVVGRMYHLMLQLRTGTTPVDKPRVTQLEPVVRRVCATKDFDSTLIAIDTSPASTVAHEDRLDHVIGHIVQNALDATRGGGKVEVKLGREGPYAVLEVVDTGMGMSPEFVRDRLFKPFETTKRDGMGIGMYESRQYVMALGGQILVSSAPGEGTRVRVMLPAGESTAAPTRTIAA